MKKPLAPLLAVVMCQAAVSADAPSVDRLVSCTDLQDAERRLACFDREIAPFATARTPPASTPPAAASRTQPAAPPVQAPAPPPVASTSSPRPAASLGEEQIRSRTPSAQEEEQALNAKIATLRKVGANAFLVTLDNGQAWRHEDQHLGSYLREGEAITIRKAALGSYRLTRDAGDAKNWIRVTRIR